MFISPYVFPGIRREIEISAQNIVEVVANYYNISVDELKTKSRKSEVILPRQICIYLIRRKTKLSYPQIAKYFNHHHTSIIYTFTTISNFLSINDKNIVNDVNNLNKILNK